MGEEMRLDWLKRRKVYCGDCQYTRQMWQCYAPRNLMEAYWAPGKVPRYAAWVINENNHCKWYKVEEGKR